MTAAAARKPAPAPDPLDVFIARTQARALLYATGELELHDAVDGCQQLAEALGLVIEIGQDEVQRLMAEAFTQNHSEEKSCR